MRKLYRKVLSAVIACALLLTSTPYATGGSLCKAENKEFDAMSEKQNGGYLATYVARYEPDLGAEFAQYPSKEYMDTYRTDVLYYGLSKDGKEYKALNNNKAILSPAGCTKLGSPSLFRRPDGTYGLIAAVDNATDQIIVFYSDDLLYFHSQRIRKLNNEGITVMNPTVQYNEGTLSYDISWEGGDGNSYITTSEDFDSFSEPLETSYEKALTGASLPDYAAREEASVFELTQEEYDRVSKKYDKLHSVAVDVNDIQIQSGDEAVLPDQVDVVYSDGSKTAMGIDWNTNGLNLKNLAAGEYTLTGTVRATTEYNSPLALYRADPYAIYDEEKGVYYFTGSDMNERSASGGGAYDAVVIRQADTLNDIAEAEEIEIWRNETAEDGTKVTGWFWAPEIHKIGGKWRIIVQGQVTEPGDSKSSTRQCIFSCNGDDLMNADNWEYTGYIHNTTDNQPVGAFDTTYFEYDGQSYYVTPKSSQLWITKVDPENPLYPTDKLVRLSGADRAYETNIGAGKAGFGSINGMPGQAIQEASSVLIHDDKIFIVYAGCTIDMMYCVCVLWTYVDSDFMNPDSWEKYPFPLLSTQDLTTTVKQADYSLTDGTDKVTGHGDSGLLPEGEGEYTGTFGPGHNSFTIDENGNPVIIYHARDWDDSYPGATGDAKYGLVDPGRHAYAKHVVFNYEGFPVCNLSPEEYLASNLRTVTVKIRVSDGKTDASNTGNNDGGKPPVNNPVDNNKDNSKNELVNIKAGDTKTIGNAKYTVLSVSASGKGTVAFSGLKKRTLSKVTIPKTVKINGKSFKVTKIGKKAFYKCKKLKKISIKATNLKNVGKNAFKATSKKLKVTVPKKKLKTYKKLFKNITLYIR
ncbi:MAG: family 43 glycosylhydrolase [Lachnospiraceae bacterium]|nr:family 43 glycosylhydrolase [Lachnospiraceae bacterium]